MLIRLIISLILIPITAWGQDAIFPVYADAIPCFSDDGLSTEMKDDIGLIVTNVSTPELHYYAPVARGSHPTAIVVIPGGGYWIEAWDLEGVDIARYLASRGYHAFVLSHRLPARTEGECKTGVALQDAQQGLRKVRGMADSLGYDQDAVGVMGFSAGGHLAGSASVHAVEKDGISSRPDFSVLVYAVTIMNKDREGHSGSHVALLGEDPDPDLMQFYDLPRQVDSLTPPTILFHASDDPGVHPRNAVEYYSALIEQGVPADLRIYSGGGHGFGGARERTDPTGGWLEDLSEWLESR